MRSTRAINFTISSIREHKTEIVKYNGRRYKNSKINYARK